MDLRILEIAANTENNKVVENYTHKSKNKNPLCGDDYWVYIKIEEDRVVDCSFEGDGCAISKSSSSMLTQHVIGLSIREAKGEYVLLHIDADDLWEPYIPSFVYLFHKLEKLIKKDVLLSGNQINIGKRSFLLKHGPYRNTHRAQDRDMWHRLAAINAYIPVDHIPFRKRLSRPRSVKINRIFRNTWYQLLYDLRQGTRTYKYILDCFTSIFRKNKKISFPLKIIRIFLIIPAFIKSIFSEPLPMPKTMPTHKEFTFYRENIRGTFLKLFEKYGSSYDLSDLSIEEQLIFKNSNV